MLVLTRKAGEEIVIVDNVRVRIVSVQNQRVRLGITAPQQLAVHREEVHHRLQDFNDCPEIAEQNEHAVGLELSSDSASQNKQGET
jgi:carbon storage regulator